MTLEYEYKFRKNRYLPIMDILLNDNKNILVTEAYVDL